MRLEWGRSGVERAARSGSVLVIVDVLSFSSAVCAATFGGATIYPAKSAHEASTIALEVGGELCVERREVPAGGRFSLSPATYLNAIFDRPLVLDSPNGATCCVLANDAPLITIGAFANLSALGTVLNRILAQTALAVSVVACGERWPQPSLDGELRFAIEDYLAAGALISKLNAARSAEAQVCANAFGATRDIPATLRACGSGIELARAGFAHDVELAAQVDAFAVVPVFSEGRITSATAQDVLRIIR